MLKSAVESDEAWRRLGREYSKFGKVAHFVAIVILGLLATIRFQRKLTIASNMLIRTTC